MKKQTKYMKKIWQLFAGLVLILASTTFTSCVDDEFDVPEMYIPKVDFDRNTTIADLKATYTGLELIEEDIIISGIVVANDKSGNLYKKMVIQDETGGIELSLDKTYLCNEFWVGQRVFVKCQGMYIGDYGELIQLGYEVDGLIDGLPLTYIPLHIFRDSIPGEEIEPRVIAINEVNDDLLSTLVTFNNVRFADGGKDIWATKLYSASNHTMTDQAGNEIVVRTSSYANFASDTIPRGFGTITGILTRFNSTWQVTIRDTSDIQDFSNIIPPPPGSGSGTFEDPYDVARGIGSSGTDPVWVEGYIVGAYETDVDPFAANFASPFRTNSNLLIADSPAETNVFNCMPVQLPSGAIRDALNLVTVPGNQGKLVKVLGTLESYFSLPGIKNLSGYWLDGNGIVPATGFYTEEFNESLGSFTQFSVTGDQVWFGDTFDGGCVTMTGYVNPGYEANEDWLISPSISLAGKTGVNMVFREAINYIETMNDYKVFVSTNYSGTGDPNSASWTELTGFTRSTGSSWTFVNTSNISLAAYEGQDIRIAFKYTSTSTKAGTWEISRMVVSAD
ncbi:MAG: DUF5689 domain-containing protein [Bacteroidota bacterium]